MSSTCIIVAARDHARFFTLQPTSDPTPNHGQVLVESGKVRNDEAGKPGTEVWSNIRAGRNRSHNGGGHGYGDHRNRHEIEVDRRFAQDIASQAEKLARTSKANHVVVVAQSKTLGNLRDALGHLGKSGIRVSEVAKDLSKLAAHDLQDELSKDHLLPKRKRVM